MLAYMKRKVLIDPEQSQVVPCKDEPNMSYIIPETVFVFCCFVLLCFLYFYFFLVACCLLSITPFF